MSDQEKQDKRPGDSIVNESETIENGLVSTEEEAKQKEEPTPDTKEADDYEVLTSIEEPEDLSLPSLESRVVYIVKEDHYGRQGFNCSVDAVADPRSQFNDYLLALYKRKTAELESIEKAKNLDDKRISEKITLNETHIAEAKKEIEAYRQNVHELEKEHLEVQKNLEVKRQELQLQHSNLAKEEKTLIANRVQDAKSEIAEIKEGLSPFVQDKRNEDDRHDIKTLKLLYQQATDKLVQLQDKLIAFSSAGMNSWTLGFLRTAGYAGIFAAGWFFTIYAMFVNGGQDGASQFMFDSQDYIGQAIKRLFSITNGASANDKIISFLIGIGLFVLFLVIVTLISIYTNTLIQKLMKRRVNSRISASSKQGNFSFNASVDAQNFHSFWLQVLPAVFIIGVVLLIISVWGLDSSANIENAGKYAASLTFGISIALAFSAFMTIYIAKIIEPRIEKAIKETDPGKQRSSFSLNWEIGASIILFLLSSLLLLLVGGIGEQWMSTLILLEFISLMLVSGFAIGYAMRYNGIIFLDRVFKTRLEQLANQLEALQNPSYLNRYTEEGQKFKGRVFDIQSQLLDLVKRKNARAIRVINEDSIQIEKEKTSKKIQAALGTVSDRLRNWFNGIRGKPIEQVAKEEEQPLDQEPEPQELSDDTVEVLGAATFKYFSAYRKIIQDLEADVKRLTAQETDLRLELASIRKRRSHFEIGRINSIRRWEQAIQDLKKYWIKQQPKYTEVKEEIEFRYSRYEYQLRDGFMLGVWSRENGLGPTNTFYPKMGL